MERSTSSGQRVAGWVGNRAAFSSIQAFLLVLLRVAVGWRFLYEGVVKLLSPKWSAAGRLEASGRFLADFLHWIKVSRDLIHASQLGMAYHTRERIFATLLLAEKCGICPMTA